MPTAPPHLASGASPGPAGRLPLIDAVRGAAMLGIVLVNFPTMNTMAGDETSTYGGMGPALDRWLGGANLVLLNGKIYPIFALLFGLGLALADLAGERSRWLATRRLLLLLGIGLLHVVLVWWGDILVVYALLGLLVLPALGWPPRRLLLAAMALLVLVPALSPLLALLDRLGMVSAGQAVLPGLGLALPAPEAVAATYRHGTFPEMLHQRALDYLSDFTPFAGREASAALLLGYGKYYAQLLGLMLLGAWAGRQGFHVRLGEDRDWTRRAWWLVAGPAALLSVLRYGVPGLDAPLAYVQADAVALAYLVGLARLLVARPRARRAFEPVGRLSLTAYLAHTTLCSLLLYATGLGLYGAIGPAALLPLSLCCYGLIAWGAGQWARRFALGPAEWVWRSLLDGRAATMRVR